MDGQNFKKNLQKFQFQSPGDSRVYSLDEKHFRWDRFFAGVIQQFCERTKVPHRLLRAYLYNAETITPFRVYGDAAGRVVRRYRGQFNDLTEDQVIELARAWHDQEQRRFRRAREDIFEEIQRRTDFLEFKYVGQYAVKPFEVYRLERQPDGSYVYQGARRGERGVDVGIAVDMISKMSNYDVAVLVSGDADFLPVVRYLKDALKQVYQFSVAKGIPPQITYLSPWPKGVVDVFGSFDELELLSKYLDRNALIPQAILSAIQDRVAELRGSA